MRLQALKARPRRRRLPPDLGSGRQAPSHQRSRRAVEAAAPNRKWIADFTYVWTAEGWLFVAAVIDLFSRRVVGWSMSAGMTAQLVTDALVMAIWRRGNWMLGSVTPIAAANPAASNSSVCRKSTAVVDSMRRSGNVWTTRDGELLSSLKTERTARISVLARATRRKRDRRLHRTAVAGVGRACP